MRGVVEGDFVEWVRHFRCVCRICLLCLFVYLCVCDFGGGVGSRSGQMRFMWAVVVPRPTGGKHVSVRNSMASSRPGKMVL